MENKVYSRKDFAKKLGIAVETLRGWEYKNYIKPLRTPTGRPFYTDEIYLEYLEKCKNKQK